MGFADGYVDVATRIAEFREQYPDGRLRPLHPDRPYWFETIGEKTFIVYASVAMRDSKDKNPGVGLAWEPFPGKTNFTRDSELQNAETSSWGRAIVAALIADTRNGVASAQEVENRSGEPAKRAEDTSGPLTDKQRSMLYNLLEQRQLPDDKEPPSVDLLTKRQASTWIDTLMGLPEVPKAERRGPLPETPGLPGQGNQASPAVLGMTIGAIKAELESLGVTGVSGTKAQLTNALIEARALAGDPQTQAAAEWPDGEEPF